MAIKRLFWIFPIIIGLVIYGNNCSVRRLSPDGTGMSSLTPEPSSGSPTSGTTPLTNFKITSKEDVDACIGETLNYDVLVNCLMQKGLINDEQKSLLASAISQCNSEKSHRVFMGICLASKGVVIDRYRAPLQSDINNCVAKVGESKLAVCLNKNGLLPLGITQVEIDSCVSAVGSTKVETCFRNRGHIPANNGAVSQFDITLCQKTGSMDIYDCLLNSGLVPAAPTSTPTVFVGQFLKVDLDTCIANQSATTNAINCLRTSGKLPKALMFHHLDRCRSLVGQSKIAACLTTNGILPASGSGVLTQALVDQCITEKGFENIMSCLRHDLGMLSRVVAQAEINECVRVGGNANLAICLNRNGILPVGLTQTVINECVTAITAAAAPAGSTLAKCFRKRGFLSKALLQGDVNNCARLVENSRIAACLNANVAAIASLTQDEVDSCITNANVGVPNIAKCLRNKGLIPKVALQEHINGCAAFVGVDNIANCLNAHGFVDPAAPVALTAELVQSCISTVGLGNVRKCLAVAKNALSKTVGADETAGCTLFSGSTTELLDACYSANGLTP